MPRQITLRKIVAPPGFKGYAPYGASTAPGSEKVELLYEEYEALKLADYDLMKHEQASELMGVSRATFARIYESARRKIARAFVESKEIISVYGNVQFNANWFYCASCNARFTLTSNSDKQKCPLCKSIQTESIKPEK